MNPARERHWVCAQRIRERRLALGLTQREVVARLGQRGNLTTNRGLSSMENGRGLDLGLLPELALALRCTVTYLLGLTGDPDSWTPGPVRPAGHEVPGPREVPGAGGTGILGPNVPAGWVRTKRN